MTARAVTKFKKNAQRLSYCRNASFGEKCRPNLPAFPSCRLMNPAGRNSVRGGPANATEPLLVGFGRGRPTRFFPMGGEGEGLVSPLSGAPRLS
jgi:hypothetical protein